MKNESLIPVRRLLRALSDSFRGLRVALSAEGAFRLELFVLVVLVPIAWRVSNNNVECALLVGSWLAVIVVEIINSAIESTVDRIGTEHNELSGRAKDLGSAAVFCAVVTAGVVWLLILI